MLGGPSAILRLGLHKGVDVFNPHKSQLFSAIVLSPKV